MRILKIFLSRLKRFLEKKAALSRLKPASFMLIGLSFLLLISNTFFISKKNELKRRLSESRQMIDKMREEGARLESDRERIKSENEKLSSDALSYLELNTKLQAQNDELKRAIGAREETLNLLRKKQEELGKEQANEYKSKNSSLSREKRELENKIKSLSAGLNKERSLYHYNLGVSYTQAKLYDEAIEAYQKSLSYDPHNAEAHYNLGILYENFANEPEEAVLHYRKYLEVIPDAPDREEVRGWINKLTRDGS